MSKTLDSYLLKKLTTPRFLIMQKYLFIFLFVFYCGILLSQTPLPGGVSTPGLWLQTNEEFRYHSSLAETYQDPLDPLESEKFTLNYNPVKYLRAAQYRFKLEELNRDQLTVFCIYQQRDTLQENHIWSIEPMGKASYELTSFRFADLQDYRYRDLRVYSQKYPELHTYTHHKDSTYSGSAYIQLGKKPQNENLPIEDFTGILPEVIVYTRVLSPLERSKVESYLSVKYGLSLRQNPPSDYLDSEGNTTWNHEENKQYNHNIFALFRDDASGLWQPRSSSSYIPEQMSLQYTSPEEVEDLEYIFVSDNAGDYELSYRNNGQPKKIGREWRISSNHFRKVDLLLNSATIENRNKEERLYLVIDPLGNPSESSFPKEYLPFPQETESIKFEGHTFDSDGNQADIFTIAEAPDMFVQTKIEFPLCQSRLPGYLSVKVEGGKAPYTLTLQTPDGKTVEQWYQSSTQEIHTIEVALGDYLLKTEDTAGRIYQVPFYMESSGAPEIQLEEQYTLIEGQSLFLDASVDMESGTTYQWYKDGKQLSQSPKLHIRGVGRYEVRVQTQSGCMTRKGIEVKGQPANNIRSVDIFPNPSQGNYMVRIILHRKANTHIGIYTIDGKLLEQKNLGEDHYFLYRGHLETPGVYLIRIQTEDDSTTQKLLIKP